MQFKKRRGQLTAYRSNEKRRENMEISRRKPINSTMQTNNETFLPTWIQGLLRDVQKTTLGVCLFCNKKAIAYHLCSMHYTRVRRNGTIYTRRKSRSKFCDKCGKRRYKKCNYCKICLYEYRRDLKRKKNTKK